MKLQNALFLVLGSLMALLWFVNSVIFLVYPWQNAVIIQFGELLSTKQVAGLYFKLPWQDVKYFDSRILTIDTSAPDRFITAEKENVLVDSYVKWRIADPQKFFESTRGEETQAVNNLLQNINRVLRDEIGKRTVKDVVTGEREEVMEVLRTSASEAAKGIGAEIIDVRLKRVDLPDAVSDNVYNNMIEERRRIANERRSSGEAEKEIIKAEADRDRTVILAEAMQKANLLRGEGDATAANIYSKAYSSRVEFYDFYRSLLAYQRSLGNANDFFLLSPDSDFFRYLKNEYGNLSKPVQNKSNKKKTSKKTEKVEQDKLPEVSGS